MLGYWAGGEMADTPALGAGAARHGGSSPLPPTNKELSGFDFACGKKAVGQLS